MCWIYSHVVDVTGNPDHFNHITIVFRIVIQYSANVSDLMQVNILLGTLSFLLGQI